MSSTLVFSAMFFSLLLLLLSGMPLAFVLISLAVLFTILLWGLDALVLTVLQTYDVMTSDVLLAIPLYVLMASILQRSGIIEALYKAMELWFRRLPGGLAVGTIAICTVMAAMTGIVGAAVAAMGILALPSMLRRGYDEKMALGVICAGGTLGILIPPSIITIVYAATAQISVGKMFAAGIVPGMVLSGLYVSYVVIRTMLKPSLAPAPDNIEVGWLEMFGSLKSLFLPTLIVFSVLGSIYAGIATPTEAAAVGVVGAMLSAMLQGQFTTANLSDAAMDTLRVTTMIMWITIGAKIFVSIFTGTGGADSLLMFIENLELNRWLVLLSMMGILVLLGLFLDEIGIILLCVPVFMPIIAAFGFDPVWFGVLFLITAQMAYITPPFGYTLFYIKGVLPPGIGMETVYRAILPFLVLQILALILFMLFPDLVTWLPNQLSQRLVS
ncbi:MAG: TRAP transporter large permease subunit [Marinobacter sp.]|uniref:TRAP transporter large permease n=1 Tax=Marinobacter sp. TaxID=50741 RepID=UPI001B6FC38A|nr:TRAP transporter large permease subunit [Marinobacter sp.]MBQ0746428.1 TRAP transporter large permease subunit [Marinobacter sp.]MBQ0813657.1 TRAP transporter large permease subunit [Marinobacter sp.]|tara:strand:+ start:3826 stop:5148 length:1323 start_codon:yes stop_codon:yes gene_type:complete